MNGVKVINLPDPMTFSDAAGLPIQIGPGAILKIVATVTLNNGMGGTCLGQRTSGRTSGYAASLTGQT